MDEKNQEKNGLCVRILIKILKLNLLFIGKGIIKDDLAFSPLLHTRFRLMPGVFAGLFKLIEWLTNLGMITH